MSEEKSSLYRKLWIDCDQELTKARLEIIRCKDENLVLRMERDALLAYYSGDYTPEWKAYIQAEIERRLKEQKRKI